MAKIRAHFSIRSLQLNSPTSLNATLAAGFPPVAQV
jgi:hypothetical protein